MPTGEHLKGKPAKNCRKIRQFGSYRHIICDFSSITEASKKLRISITAIANCLTKRSKTAGHYYFEYIE